jgi:hypothetical protein
MMVYLSVRYAAGMHLARVRLRWAGRVWEARRDGGGGGTSPLVHAVRWANGAGETN